MGDDLQTQTAVRIARPTLAVGGRDQPGLAAALLTLMVTETAQGLYRCEVRLGNWGDRNGKVDFLYFDRQLIDFGKQLQIKLGQDTLFDGRITALQGAFQEGATPELGVYAEDRLQDLRMTRRTVSFASTTDKTVFEQIASDHGLTPDIQLQGPQHPVLAQVNQSDLAFLRERARALDAEIWVEGTTLKVRRRGDRAQGGPVKLGYGNELRSFEVMADLATQRTKVKAGGWDVSSKQAATHECGDEVLGAELGQDESGASILTSALGARKESLAHGALGNAQESQARAEAHFRQQARRFVVGRGMCQTDARLKVGAAVELVNLGPLFTGKYVLSEVHHLFDGTQGLRTEFVAERCGLSRGSP